MRPLIDGVRGDLGLGCLGQLDRQVAQVLAEPLRAGEFARVYAHVAGRPLHEDAMRVELAFDPLFHEARIVGRVFENPRIGHHGVGREIHHDGNRLA